MVYIKIDNNKNGTITEISAIPFSGLSAHESQQQVNYDFPAQPTVFYRWDGMAVVENDEDVVRTYFEDSLSGLDMTPHIESALNADFSPDDTKDLTIEGVNFTPFTTVEVEGLGNMVNTVYFDSPKKIRAQVTTGSVEGKFNIIVKNNDLDSGTSGYDLLHVKSKTEVDLRTIDPNLLGLEMSSGINYQQENTKGLRFYSNSNSWNRGVKFGAYTWQRIDNVTFEIIFTTVSDTLFMVGIGSSSLNVNSLQSAYYKQEIGMYHQNDQTSAFYGGGDVSNWVQNIGVTVPFDHGLFYKVKFENSGGSQALCLISQVNPDDWDDETVLHSWISDCPADDAILTPFVLPQAASGAYYITGFRY
jgi:hypothetical protein